MRLMLAAAAASLFAACTPTDPAVQDAAEPAGAEASAWNTLSGEAPLVIAHRGASGYRPEHTALAYELAVEQGADVIEPDLVMTADGVLIARHDPYLSTTTDIASRPEFADRRRGMAGRDDWWASDFTLAEIETLRAIQHQPGRSSEYDGQAGVMTFDAVIDLWEAQRTACACDLGLEPEVKLPAEQAAMGLDPLPVLVEVLERRGLNAEDAPVVIQSFDADFLIRLNDASPVRQAMLVSGEPGYDAGGRSIEDIAEFADGIGAYKALLITPEGESTGYVEAAHAAGLEVHVWTVRDDRPPHVGETVEDELRALYALGVDAVFTDHPDTAVAVRAAMTAE